MSDYWIGKEEDDKRAAEKYRLLQAKEMLLRFQEAHGRPAESIEELEKWVAAGGIGDKPIKPRDSLFQEEKEEAMKMTIRQDLRLELKYRCVVCSGTGKVSGHFHDGEPWEETCPVCNGTGEIPDKVYKEYTHDTADDRETDLYPDLP